MIENLSGLFIGPPLGQVQIYATDSQNLGTNQNFNILGPFVPLVLLMYLLIAVFFFHLGTLYVNQDLSVSGIIYAAVSGNPGFVRSLVVTVPVNQLDANLVHFALLVSHTVQLLSVPRVCALFRT